ITREGNPTKNTHMIAGKRTCRCMFDQGATNIYYKRTWGIQDRGQYLADRQGNCCKNKCLDNASFYFITATELGNSKNQQKEINQIMRNQGGILDHPDRGVFRYI